MNQTQSGFANVNNAKIYYEMTGAGTPLVMIHAGVADNRQWNNEFEYFAQSHKVLRYDMRGYGKSEPVDGEFNLLNDLVALLDALKIDEPIIIIGCSMGGGLAMDFALENPSRIRALIMVGSGPNGLDLDVETPAIFAEAEKAWEAGDIDLTAEIETQIWFDGTGRTPEQVDPSMRKLAFEMNHIALMHESKKLGKHLPNTESPAFDRLKELNIPVLVIAGKNDVPYILAASDFMAENIKSVKKVMMDDAAHLPNMDHPKEFQEIVAGFLKEYS